MRWLSVAVAMIPLGCRAPAVSRVDTIARETEQLHEWTKQYESSAVADSGALRVLGQRLAIMESVRREAKTRAGERRRAALAVDPLLVLDNERLLEATREEDEQICAAWWLQEAGLRSVCRASNVDALLWVSERFVHGSVDEQALILGAVSEAGNTEALAWMAPLLIDPRFESWNAGIYQAFTSLFPVKDAEFYGDLLREVYVHCKPGDRIWFLQCTPPTAKLAPVLLDELRTVDEPLAGEIVRILVCWSPFLPDEEICRHLLELSLDCSLSDQRLDFLQWRLAQLRSFCAKR